MLSQNYYFGRQHKVMPRTYVAPPTGPHKDFALRFREAVNRAGLPGTLAQLKQVFGVSAPTVHDWRHGEQLPSSAMMAIIASKTNVNYDWLATGRGQIGVQASQDAHQLAQRIERAPVETRRYIEAILAVAELGNTAHTH